MTTMHTDASKRHDAVLLFEPEVVPWLGSHLPHWALQMLVVPLWGLVIAYVILSRFVRHVRIFGYELDLPSPGMALTADEMPGSQLGRVPQTLSASACQKTLPVAASIPCNPAPRRFTS